VLQYLRNCTVLYCTVPYLSVEKFIRHRSESVNFELDDNECGGREGEKWWWLCDGL